MILKKFNPRLQPNQMPAEGQYKLLNDGNEMEALVVMLREAVQNSWDARNRNSRNVKFILRGLSLSKENTAAICKAIGDSGYGFDLSEDIRKIGTALEISDCNTIGLSGPTGFDNLGSKGKQNRFIKFVHTLGNAGQTVGDGGSFGFGKTSLYKASKIGTVAIYTKTKVENKIESRFIIKNLDKRSHVSFSNSGVYWWGKKIVRSKDADGGTWIEPLKDSEADSLWRSIGGSPFVNSEDTGTKLMVFAPELSKKYSNPGKSLLQANLQHISKNITHFFWAKWPGSDNSQGIDFHIKLSENNTTSEVKLDHPDNVYPYQVFRTCLKACKSNNSGVLTSPAYNFKEIKSYNPAQTIGNLVFTVIDDRKIDLKYDGFFNSSVCHIALLRNVEFVVEYFNHTINIDFLNKSDESEKKIIGVFRTHDNCRVRTGSDESGKIDLNEVFRTAENQTHESWSSENALALGPYCRTYVNKTFNEIKSGVNSFIRDKREKKVDRSSEAKAEIMSYLGQFISGIQGGGQPVIGEKRRDGSKASQSKSEKGQLTLDIETIENSKSKDAARYIFLRCILEKRKYSGKIKLVPICTDEEGNLTIRPDGRSSLPVKISSVDTDRMVEVLINDNGTAELAGDIPDELKLNINIILSADCKFTVKAEK